MDGWRGAQLAAVNLGPPSHAGHPGQAQYMLGASTPTAAVWGTIVGGAVLSMYMAPVIISTFVQNKWLGFDNRLSNKDMLKRSALLGGAIGAIPAILWSAGTFTVVREG